MFGLLLGIDEAYIVIVAEYKSRAGNRREEEHNHWRAACSPYAGQVTEKGQPAAQDERHRHAAGKHPRYVLRTRHESQYKPGEQSQQQQAADIAVDLVIGPRIGLQARRESAPQRREKSVNRPQPVQNWYFRAARAPEHITEKDNSPGYHQHCHLTEGRVKSGGAAGIVKLRHIDR